MRFGLKRVLSEEEEGAVVGIPVGFEGFACRVMKEAEVGDFSLNGDSARRKERCFAGSGSVCYITKPRMRMHCDQLVFDAIHPQGLDRL